MILSIIRNYSKKGNDNIDGYQPLHESKVDAAPPSMAMNAEIDEYAKNKLEFFVKSVTEQHIPLFVIISPIYLQPFPETKSEQASKKILAKYQVPLWDYKFDTTYVKQALFYDNVHMNTKGATMFSEMIAKRVEETLNKTKQDPFTHQTGTADTTAMVRSDISKE
jgi:lysophospholipase L1-like esterase